MIELRHLEYFIALAETLHFGRAAEKVHVTQPALSQQIKKLEARIGVVLVDRTPRAVALTAAGQAFLAEARRALAQVDRAVHVAQRAGRGEVGRLRIGFIGSVLFSFLPAALRSFRARFPDVELDLHECNTHHQHERLRRAELDLGFLYAPLGDDQITLERVFSQSFVVALSETHPLAGRASIALAELAREPFVMVTRDREPGLYDCHIGACQQAGFVPNVVQRASQFQTILGLVSAGIGVYPMAAHVRHMVHEGVVFVPVSEPTATIELCAAWHQTTPAIANFMAVVRETVAGLARPS